MATVSLDCYAGVPMPETNRLSTFTNCLIPDPEGSWYRTAALSFLGGDESLLNELLNLFLADSPKLLSQVQQSLLLRDRHRLELAAHTLKGQLQYLGAREAAGTAENLEAAGRTGQMEGAEASMDDLRGRLVVLWNALSHIAGA